MYHYYIILIIYPISDTSGIVYSIPIVKKTLESSSSREGGKSGQDRTKNIAGLASL